mmetsp:Transcript_49825/g.98458  ORF Transcript_49825/g.98458 Transcript_49825/m.98458 type:complete len:96 (-) Transcript_49825:230-517(-)
MHAPPLSYCPGLHPSPPPSSSPASTSWHVAEPGFEVVPLGQAVHWVEPAVSEKVPDGHKSQVAEPVVEEKVPGWQYSHAALPAAGADVPDEQDKQ